MEAPVSKIETGAGSATDDQISSNREDASSARLSAWRMLPVHPFFFAAFPVLALYSRNVAVAQLSAIWHPLGLALLGTIIVWMVAALLLRQISKGAVVASALVLVFFSYGHLRDVLPVNFRGATAPICIVTLLAVVAAVIRSRKPLAEATFALNLTSILLVLPSCWNIGASLLVASPARSGSFDPASVEPRAGLLHPGLSPVSSGPSSVADAGLPDIYYIILDAYGRSDSLKAYYGFDNTPFLHALEQRGFYIARNSHSNYDQTGLCLASSLNMRYLEGAEQGSTQPSGSEETLREMIDRNEVAARLRKRGYHYVNVWSGAGQTRVVTADVVFGREPEAPEMSSLEQEMLSMSASVTTGPQKSQQDYSRHRERIEDAFHNLATVPRLPYPKFVFVHIMAPHPPFVFGANGEPVDPSYLFNYSDGSWLLGMISRDDYRKGYTAQVQFINRQVIKAVDNILRQSRRPPVIIVQGDHGSRMNLNWESQEKSDLRETFSILNAYYVPSSVRPHLYDSITPINSFRILLRELFREKMTRLPDRSFYSTARAPMVFSDVTRLVNFNKFLARPSVEPTPEAHVSPKSALLEPRVK